MNSYISRSFAAPLFSLRYWIIYLAIELDLEILDHPDTLSIKSLFIIFIRDL